MLKYFILLVIFLDLTFAKQVQKQTQKTQNLVQTKPIQRVQGKAGINSSYKKSLISSSQLQAEVSTYMGNSIDTEDYIKVSLIDVVLETVSQSNNAKAAREKVRQSKIKLDDAYSGYLPSIDGTYKRARTEAKPGVDGDKQKLYGDESYKLTVTQNLYAGGSTYNEIKRLEKNMMLQKMNIDLQLQKR